MGQKYVEVERAIYAELLKDQQFLAALQAVGVDNWEGYDIAIDLIKEWEAENQPEKPIVQINNWFIVRGGALDGDQLRGNVIDHPNFPEGTFVTTSKIIASDIPYREGIVVETLNTNYKLLSPMKIEGIGEPE